MLQTVKVGNLGGRCQAFDRMRRIVNAYELERLQAGELVDHVKELSDTEPFLDFCLADKLDVV